MSHGLSNASTSDDTPVGQSISTKDLVEANFNALHAYQAKGALSTVLLHPKRR